MWRSADIARINHPASPEFYQRKRGAGTTHAAALLAIPRRQAKVVYSLMKNHTHDVEPNPSR